MIPVTERIRQSLASLHMARALETLDQTLSPVRQGRDQRCRRTTRAISSSCRIARLM